MKKAILWFIVLIIIAGVGFYFGWVNVKPGTFCLAHSTLTGTIGYPLKSGHIYWFWQKLIPKSFQVYTLQKSFYTTSVDSSFALPGSDMLSEYGNFELAFKLEARYKIDFEAASKMVNSGIIENFQKYIEDDIDVVANETVSSFMTDELSGYLSSKKNFDYLILKNLKDKLTRNVRNSLEEHNFKEVNINLTFTRVPQLEIYFEALRKYLYNMQTLALLKEEELKEYSQYSIQEKEREIELEKLRRYGELIREYPEILKYLYIQKFGERAEVIVIPQDEKTGFPSMLESLIEKPEAWLQKPPSAPVTPVPPPEEKQKTPETELKAPLPETEEEKEVEQKEEKKWYDILKFWKYLSK